MYKATLVFLPFRSFTKQAIKVDSYTTLPRKCKKWRIDKCGEFAQDRSAEYVDLCEFMQIRELVCKSVKIKALRYPMYINVGTAKCVQLQ